MTDIETHKPDIISLYNNDLNDHKDHFTRPVHDNDDLEDDFDDDLDYDLDDDLYEEDEDEDEDEDEEDWDDSSWIDDDCILITDDDEDYWRDDDEDEARKAQKEKDRAQRFAARDYIEQYAEGTADRQVAMLFAHLGLTGEPPEMLGGNHPDRVKERLDQQARGEDGKSGSSAPKLTAPHNPIYDREKPKTPYYSSTLYNSSLARSGRGASGDKKDIMDTARWARIYKEGRSLSAKQAAKDLGHSLRHFYLLLSLTRLPEEVQDMVSTGALSLAHASAIANMRDPAPIARLIIRRGITVRGAETIARRLRYVNPDGSLTKDTAIPHSWRAENFMEDALGMKVEVKDRGGRGKIVLHYRSPEQFQMIANKLTAAYFGLGPQDIG